MIVGSASVKAAYAQPHLGTEGGEHWGSEKGQSMGKTSVMVGDELPNAWRRVALCCIADLESARHRPIRMRS